MSVLYEFTHGWTEPIDVQLLKKGIPEDLTGKVVTMASVDKSGGTPITGTITILNPTLGIVRVSPNAGDIDFAKSPYRVWWIITGAGLQASSPNGEPDIWKIHQFA